MNPLLPLHRSTNAETQRYGDIEIVTTFGEMPAEYSAIHKSAALMDLPQRAIIQFTGPDRLTFLNNLVTNQTFDKQTRKGLAEGEGVYAFVLNAKSGRIVTDLNILERGDRTLLELDRRLIAPVIDALEKYRFAEKVKFESRADDLHEIALFGPKTLSDLDGLNSRDATRRRSSIQTKVANIDVVAWTDDQVPSPSYKLILPTASAKQLWIHLISTGIRPIGWAAFNSARIEVATPLFGIDFDENTLPHETGPLLNKAISFTKGCYPGQEIVARMHARGGTAKNIVAIRMADDALPIAGTKIYDANQNEIGAITSSTISPILSNAAVALGIVKRPHFAPGATLIIPAEGQMRSAKVVEPPFKKSSDE